MATDLTGVSVLVAGAGLAGLTAAIDLTRLNATVTVVDARNRVGGRVWTIRSGFTDGQHAEAGGDLIDDDHDALKALVAEHGLSLTRILRKGFAYARPDTQGRVRIVRPAPHRGWERLRRSLRDPIERFMLGERRWDTPIAAALGRHSVAQWLEAQRADDELRQTTLGLRGFFLAEPDELSLLALTDAFATNPVTGAGRMYRVDGGNDRLPAAMAAVLGDRVRLGTELVALSQRGRRVRASLKHKRQAAELQVDYFVSAIPASLLRRIPITPALPSRQHDAITRLKYGRGTKSLLQFARRFWVTPGRARAFGSALPFGAVWDGNEEQRGPAGILSFLAGGAASDLTADLVAKDGIEGLAKSVDWLGRHDEPLVASKQVQWEADSWSRGGYAIFDPSFDPSLRGWLAQPVGRMFFAGEHTSMAWQGYMNGAVESGRRAAAEVAAAHELLTR